mgnify:CR=1 FL=1
MKSCQLLAVLLLLCQAFVGAGKESQLRRGRDLEIDEEKQEQRQDTVVVVDELNFGNVLDAEIEEAELAEAELAEAELDEDQQEGRDLGSGRGRRRRHHVRKRYRKQRSW